MNRYVALKNALSRKGFDIHVLFSSSVYNDYLGENDLLQYKLPIETDSVCMLVGNTKKLWPHFISSLRESNDPLDEWSSSEIFKITSEFADKFSIYFVFDEYLTFKGRMEEIVRGKKRIAFQTLGYSIGFSITVPGTGLSVTPEFGPWFAFRAVIVFHDDYSHQHHEVKLSNLQKWIDNAMTVDQINRFEVKTIDIINVQSSFHDFIALRKEIGILLRKENYEYEYNQMMYHYTKLNKYLKF